MEVEVIVRCFGIRIVLKAPVGMKTDLFQLRSSHFKAYNSNQYKTAKIYAGIKVGLFHLYF